MRRDTSPFNLSLLDLLTAALGAVIFLFVITPRGGAGASVRQQASIFFDTTTMKIHGTLPDSLLSKRAGDTLFAMLVDFQPSADLDPNGLEAELAAARKRISRAEAANDDALAQAERAEAARLEAEARAQRQPQSLNQPQRPNTTPTTTPTTPQRPTVVDAPTKPQPTTPTAPPATQPRPDEPYRGHMPNVAAAVSFEISWPDASDNVDLYVCQGNNCVYGNRKRDDAIGAWDSGKSRNRLFGNDLRTNLEAVRQFDKILPGTYTVYAVFKESEKGSSNVNVEALVYTKDAQGKPRGKTFNQRLSLGTEKVRLVTVTINDDGTFTTR